MSFNIKSDKVVTRTPPVLTAIAVAVCLLIRGHGARADEKVGKTELPKLTDMQLPTAENCCGPTTATARHLIGSF